MSAEHKKGVPYTDFQTILGQEKYRGISGLDMGPTVEWYGANKDMLAGILQRNIQFASPAGLPTTTDLDQISLERSDLSRLFGLFPKESRDRSIVTGIKGAPPLWFSTNSVDGQQIPTTNIDEILSDTAVIPGYTDFSKWPQAEISLYQLPETTVTDPSVRTLITAEAAVHEHVHGVTTNLMYGDTFIKLPQGEVIHGLDFIAGVFGTLAEKHKPISHYSSQFRDADGNFKNPEDPRTPIGEELAETTAVLLLGYGSGVLNDMRFDPLVDRPELKKVINDLLRSNIVSHEEGHDVATITAGELIKRYSVKTP